jgi:hypothetical protein
MTAVCLVPRMRRDGAAAGNVVLFGGVNSHDTKIPDTWVWGSD